MSEGERDVTTANAADLLKELNAELKRIFPVQGPRLLGRDEHISRWVKFLPNEPRASVEESADYARNRRAKQLVELRSNRPRPSDSASSIAFNSCDERHGVLNCAIREIFSTFKRSKNDVDLQRLCVMSSLSVAIGLVHRVPMPPIEKAQLIDLLSMLALWLEHANKGTSVRQLERRRMPKKRPEDGPAKTQFRGLCIREVRRLVGEGASVADSAAKVYAIAKGSAKQLGVRGKSDKFTPATISGWYSRDRAARNGRRGLADAEKSFATTLASVLDGVFGENDERTFKEQLKHLIQNMKSYPTGRAFS